MKKRIVSIFVLFLLLIPLISFAQNNNNDNYGLDDVVSNPTVNEALRAGDIGPGEGRATAFLASQTGSAIGTVLSFLGVIFLILTITGGIMWMTAGGNTEQVAKARKLITSAVIGLVIIFAAYALTSFIGDILTSS